jgi:hypothetical protein
VACYHEDWKDSLQSDPSLSAFTRAIAAWRRPGSAHWIACNKCCTRVNSVGGWCCTWLAHSWRVT